jgi:hypothetical protein
VLARNRSLVALPTLVVLVVLGFRAVSGWSEYLDHKLDSVPRLDVALDGDASGDGPVAGPVDVLLAGVAAGEPARIADGLDRRVWVPGSHRAETVTVLHVPADRSLAFLISVPLDAPVSVGGGTPTVGSAFSDGGPALLAVAVEQATDLDQDHLAVADWSGFGYLTDPLAVPAPLLDGSPTTAGESLSHVPLVAGADLLGAEDRLRALSEEVMSSQGLSDPRRLRYLVAATARSVAVDRSLTTERLKDLARSLARLGSGDVIHLTASEYRSAVEADTVLVSDSAP